MTTRISLFFLCWLVFVSQPFAMADSLSLGWEDWKPYQYESPDGDLTGLDIDLVKAVFENQGKTLKFVQLPWKRHLGNVEAGLIDLAASASRTPEREQYAYFSDPYRSESAALFIRKADQNKYQFSSLDDIIGTNFSLAVVRGYYYGEKFSQLMKNADFRKHVHEVNDNQLAQRQLVRGRVDGFLEDPIAASFELEEEGLADQVINVLPIYSDDIYVMFSKKTLSEADVEAFNKSLAEVRKAGHYDEIIGRYNK
ncbi:MAG: substrate-binding periplasmic protein [Methyloligellaceae bacterium]